jgi:hypothetical protein
MKLEEMVSETENLEALAWLDHYLEDARARSHRKAEYILEAVLEEVMFELNPILESPTAR